MQLTPMSRAYLPCVCRYTIFSPLVDRVIFCISYTVPHLVFHFKLYLMSQQSLLAGEGFFNPVRVATL